MLKLLRPRIAISGICEYSVSVHAMICRVREAGGIPIFIGQHKERLIQHGFTKASVYCDGNQQQSALFKAALHHAVEENLPHFDALMVMGSESDIHPKYYRHHYHKDDERGKLHPETQLGDNRARELYEFVMLEKVIARKIPLLGICGGMQRINVALGGTLHQHVNDLKGRSYTHDQRKLNIDFSEPTQAVRLMPGSMLQHLVGSEDTTREKIILENSMHHQGVERVGRGLRVAARSDDNLRDEQGERGLVKAFEADPRGRFKNQTILGVQWHPEFGASVMGVKLVASMMQKARQYAKRINNTPLQEGA